MSSAASSHLSYPSQAPAPDPAPPRPPANSPATILKDRLYVGNLHPSVDEYTLLQLFSKHGKITRLDFLFHKTGPAKGKPRGYAFVEFSAKEDANKALVALHDRLVRGRKLVVTFAHQAPSEASYSASSNSNRRYATDTTRPTALSLLKTHNRPGGTKEKIAALEAKLKSMKASAPGSSDPGSKTHTSPPVPPHVPPNAPSNIPRAPLS